jgi:hypothetical protein
MSFYESDGAGVVGTDVVGDGINGNNVDIIKVLPQLKKVISGPN